MFAFKFLRGLADKIPMELGRFLRFFIGLWIAFGVLSPLGLGRPVFAQAQAGDSSQSQVRAPVRAQNSPLFTERSASARVNDSIVYHGKLVNPSGQAVTGTVEVTIKIFSPEPSLCLLWSEKQTITARSGGFSMELGYGDNRLSGTGGGAATDFRSVFINNTGLTHSSASCVVGSSYTPSANDDRLMSAEFIDGGVSVAVEKIPIKSVPFAKQASEVGGFGIGNLFKISGAGSTEQFSPEEVTRLKAASAGGSANQILGISGTGGVVEYKSITAGTGIAVTHTSNGIQISATGGGGTGSVSSVGVSGLPLTVSSATSTPMISIAQANGSQAGYLSAADWALFNSKQAAGSYLTSISGNDVNSALGYSSVNKAGDTMTGILNLPSGGLAVGTNQLVVNGGNVGIATASPNRPLQVNASDGFGVSILATGGVIARNDFSFGQTGYVIQRGSSGQSLTFNSQELVINEQGADLDFRVESLAKDNAFFVKGGSGNVGIGTSSPSSDFHLHSSAATSIGQNSELRLSTAYSSQSYSYIRHLNSNSNGGNLVLGTSASGAGYGAISFEANNNVQFAGAGGDVFFLKTNGRVSMGGYTDGSDNRLQVFGNTYISDKLGIGTNSPQEKLHVAGKIRAQEICDESGGNCKVLSGGWTGGSVTSVAVGGAPLSVVNGTSTPTISIAQANGSQAGFLSAADWTSFNNKQPAGAYLTGITGTQVTTALGYTPISSTSSSQVISAIGYTPQAALGFVPVSNALPTNQTYIGNGSNVAAAGFFGVGQLRNASGTAQIPASCAASQTLTWSAVTDVFNCTNIGSLPASSITTGTIDSARLPFGASLWQDAGSGKIHYSGGNVGIGTTNPGEKLEVNGNVKATSFISTSDQRMKTHIQDVEGLVKILKLRGVSYNWIKNGEPDMGVIAQELEKVFPELVVTNKEGYKAVKYQALIAPLIEAVKDLHEENKALREELARQKQDLDLIKKALGISAPD